MRLFKFAAAMLLWTSSKLSAIVSISIIIPPSAASMSSNTKAQSQTAEMLPFELQGLSGRSLADGITLRILPIGASIVWGYASSDGNGFRYPLRNALVYGGNPVNMIGDVQTGTMFDNDCECYGGNTIAQSSAHADAAIPYKPNLVIMHMGSNDMSIDYTNAHIRYGDLIDKFFNQIPNVTIIASTLLPLLARQNEANYFNAHLPEVIRSRQAAGKKIALADMSSSFFSYGDQVDGQHPNDFGYKKMAAVFYQTIVEVAELGWLLPPINTGISDVTVGGGTSVCDKNIDGSMGPYQIQYQLGFPDGDYVHASADGGIYYELANPSPDGIHWADMDGDGIDDYVYVSVNLVQGLGVSFSAGGGHFGSYSRAASFPASCNRANVKFADINGDKRSDVCCVDDNGDFQCWLNRPTAGDARVSTWESTGYLKQGSGFTLEEVRLADIDGDGKADYVGINSANGSIWGWRNTGYGYVQPSRWVPFNGVAFGLPTGLSTSGWRFADLNGDSKDDLLHVDDHGRVTTWINQRGLSSGALTPNWIYFGTHGGDEVKPINITFGKFWGSGRSDYSINFREFRNTTNSGGGADGPNGPSSPDGPNGSGGSGGPDGPTSPDGPNPSETTGTPVAMASMIQNLDSGSTSVRGDGTRYCDMTGDGKDDTIWISIMGEINVWGNVHIFGEQPPLTAYGPVLNVNRTRREIVLADFNGDKKCDVLLVDKLTGATTVYLNDFSSGTFAFTNIGVVTGSAICTTQYGPEFQDNGVRWHDIDGDGQADFLCFKRNGVVYGYLNKGVGNMINQGVIKHAESRERQDLRMRDINGDGRADLIWVDQKTSRAQVWYNEGPSGDAPGDEAAGTSAFRWRFAGDVAYGSSGRGTCIEFANINGIGRADYILVYPVTNRAFSEFNVCPGGLEAVAPNLPSPPPITYPVISAATNCISGQGAGDYDELCSFTCSYGLCPPPCVCTSTGSPRAPPAVNPQLSGAAVVDLDPGLFDLLCAFACSRGLCPDISCVEFITLNTPSDLPPISGGDLDPLDIGGFDQYSEGDDFVYTYPDDPSFQMSLSLLGDAATWSTSDNADCGANAGPGDYGSVLGCEAMAFSYLFYGVSLQELDSQDTDIHTRNAEAESGHIQYQRLEKWSPGTGTTHEKLLAQAPLNTWVLVGNGSYHGIPHELHFMKQENFTSYRVVQNQTFDTLKTLDARGQGRGGTGVLGYTAQMYQRDRAVLQPYADEVRMRNNARIAASWAGTSVEKTSAISGRHLLCYKLMSGQIGSDPGLLEWNANIYNIPVDDLNTYLTRCDEQMLTRGYTIYAIDPKDINDLAALLKSFPPEARVVPHNSINGFGMLFWTAELNLAQYLLVKGHRQTGGVHPVCEEGCEDPSDESRLDVPAPDINNTIIIESHELKRQTQTIITQRAPTDDLAFVSNTIGTSMFSNRYRYDSSAGNNVFVYVIESRGFQLDSPEFSQKNQDGLSIRDKITGVKAFPPTYIPLVEQKSHGTTMLAAMCGAEFGVAKNIWPKLYTWDWKDDQRWLLTALDNIYSDFNTATMVSSEIAKLAILNMSFGIQTKQEYWIKRLEELLRRLEIIGVLSVTSAGNRVGVAPFKYPALFADPENDNYIPSVVVVGGIEKDGAASLGSCQAPWVTIWAPNRGFKPFKNAAGNWDVEPAVGTSLATAKVSALAAYFVGFSSLRSRLVSPYQLTQYIQERAFPRGTSILLAIYNGANG